MEAFCQIKLILRVKLKKKKEKGFVDQVSRHWGKGSCYPIRMVMSPRLPRALWLCPQGRQPRVLFHKKEILVWDQLLLPLCHHLKASTGPASPGSNRWRQSIQTPPRQKRFGDSLRNMIQTPKKQQANTREFLKLTHFTNRWCSNQLYSLTS